MKKIPSAVLVKVLLLCIALVAAGLVWRESLQTGEIPTALRSGIPGQLLPTLHHPLFEFAKLVVAFLIGLAVTVVHRITGHDPAFGTSMEHAQILLCVSGALMMIIIGDSLARAFGIAGAASIIRFRTPVEDPKDTIILFLALGLGMACGLGAFAVVGLGTAFLCGVLIYLSTADQPKKMTLTVTSADPEFPNAHVQEVLSRFEIRFETQEILHGPTPTVKYRVLVDPNLRLEKVSEELQAQGGPSIDTVSWEMAKKKKA